MHFRDDFLKKNYSDEVYCGIGHFYKKKILLGGDDEMQGGRTWQPFVGGKNGHENFRQAHIYNFCDKCVVFARNHKLTNLTQ